MKHLDKSELRAMSSVLNTVPMGKRHGKPYAKGEEGRDRRKTRKAAIRRKRAWLD